ncbi:hypothetical protein [Neobacillus notoginsengisoli]|uniref:hypothetical protein n=1 Tax=Neobacillus notoginsengisoli TaxID=1578198 RepID=UPI0018651E40|nr:hypothetical protein [Neobacillus notoginsengisoli]
MNSSLSTFLKIGITVIAISAFLFVFGYGMIKTESDSYKSTITSVDDNLPSGTTP